MPRSVTISDIAEAAGVSRQTVTRAMNGMPRISDSTRARVLEVSERLGYRPSRFAANLARSQKTRTIAFVVDSFRNPFYSELASDLLDEASARGWQMTIASHENIPELDLISRLANQVDAIAGYLGVADEESLITASRGVPLVLLERPAGSQTVHSVAVDFDAGLDTLVRQLRERGARRFGMLESHLIGTEYVSTSRRRAFEAAVAPDAAAVVVCDARTQSVDAGEAGFHELLDRSPETDTVIAFSDLMALGALRAARVRGLDVPGAVRIVGIDGLSLGAAVSPSLTSLAIVGRAITREVADVLQDSLAPGGVTAQHRMVVPSVVWRESA